MDTVNAIDEYMFNVYVIMIDFLITVIFYFTRYIQTSFYAQIL